MPTLDAALSRFFEHPGVERVVLLGRDGLVVRYVGPADGRDEGLAARIPGLLAAGDALGNAAGNGSMGTAVLELETGVLIVQPLSRELALAVLLRAGAGFRALLRDVRSSRSELLHLL